MQPENFDEDAVHTGPPEPLSWERSVLRKLLVNNAGDGRESHTNDSGQNQIS
jgi:hypothetical protein